MFMRLTSFALLFILLSLFCGCCTTPPRVANGQEARPETTYSVVPTILLDALEPGKEYRSNMPLKLSVEYQSPYSGSDVSEFEAIVIPLKEGGTYSLRLEVVEDDQDNVLMALLVVSDGAIYTDGRYPAVGGGQVGTHGDGTRMILEAADGIDYVYLLKDNALERKVFVFKRGTTTSELEPLKRDNDSDPSRYAGYRWRIDGTPEMVPPADVDTQSPERLEIMNRLIDLAKEDE